MLDIERGYYDAHLSELLKQFRNRFVVVKGQDVIGAFDTMNEALREGARRFGLEPFLVRRVQEVSSESSIPALALGLFNADPPPPIRSASDGQRR